MDFRKHKRRKLDLPVSFAGEHAAGEGTLFNLSQAGCGVVSQEKVPVGSFLELLIQPQGGQDPVKIEVAVVRYTLPDRFGLDFLQVAPAEQQKLKQLL